MRQIYLLGCYTLGWIFALILLGCVVVFIVGVLLFPLSASLYLLSVAELI